MRNNKSYNYTDEFSDIVHTARFINAAELSGLFFSAPKWITLLMKIRNAIMKPFGLKRGKDLSDLVHIETENLATISKNDKHLDLEIAFMTERVECDSQRISVSTKVRFHNRFGKCYFAIIKPFHNLICKTLLLRAKNNIEKSVCRYMNTDYKVGDFIYDADIYDGLNKFLSDLEFYKKWLPKNKEAKILELCCGTGRLTIPIAKDGYDIKGVDYTSSMLERAKEKALQAGLKIDFIEADIRELNLGEKFDLIFIPFNSIHHLYKNEDLFEALNTVKKHLKDNGLFLLDCFNPNIQYIVENEREQHVMAEYTTNDGRSVLIRQSMHYESASQINRIKWQYFIDGAFHSVQNMDMRLFFPQELNSYLHQAGFNVVHKFGDFTECEFNDNSEKQIYILEPKK